LRVGVGGGWAGGRVGEKKCVARRGFSGKRSSASVGGGRYPKGEVGVGMVEREREREKREERRDELGCVDLREKGGTKKCDGVNR
jgi:hypothetical protein